MLQSGTGCPKLPKLGGLELGSCGESSLPIACFRLKDIGLFSLRSCKAHVGSGFRGSVGSSVARRASCERRSAFQVRSASRLFKNVFGCSKPCHGAELLSKDRWVW